MYIRGETLFWNLDVAGWFEGQWLPRWQPKKRKAWPSWTIRWNNVTACFLGGGHVHLLCLVVHHDYIDDGFTRYNLFNCLQLEKVQTQAEKEKESIQKEHDNNMCVHLCSTIIIHSCCHLKIRRSKIASFYLSWYDIISAPSKHIFGPRYGLTQLLELLGKMLTSERGSSEEASAWWVWWQWDVSEMLVD